MKKLLKFVVITAFVLGGWVLAAASLHVVRAPGTMMWGLIPTRIEFVPKNTITFQDTWIDATKWTVVDVSNHSAARDRLIQAGKTHLLQQAMDTPAPVAVVPSKPAEVPTAASVAADPAYQTSTPAVEAKKAEPASKSIFDFSDQKKEKQK